jgi:tripartite-type tricarboxylate transporter receptor subunit TctC
MAWREGVALRGAPASRAALALTRGALLAVLVLACAAQAETSQAPIQIIVPFAPGASADGIGRIVAGELGAALGRQVVVENKAGAGGALGLALLAKAAPDGNTLAIGATGALVINPHIPNTGSLDPLRELTPVAKLIDIPIVLVATPRTGPKTIKEMVERSKASPNGLSYGSTGTNSGQHLVVELLKRATGANLTHVPYRGSAPAVTDVLGGQIPLASVDLTSAHEHIKAGSLVALGVTSRHRARTAPEIATIAENGVLGFDGTPGFIGLFAPAGTPAPLVRRLSREVAAILAKPEVQARIGLLSVEPAYEDDTAFARTLATESAKWKGLLPSLASAKG